MGGARAVGVCVRVRACGPGVSYFLSSFLSFLCFSEIEVKFSFERGSSNFFDDGCAGSSRFEWDQVFFLMIAVRHQV